MIQQDPNAAASVSRVAKCRSQKVPKHGFGHFRSSEQQTDDTSGHAILDFLLVFYSVLQCSY